MVRSAYRNPSVSASLQVLEVVIDKMIAAGIILGIMVVSLLLFCCVCAGSDADRAEERMRDEDKRNGNG